MYIVGFHIRFSALLDDYFMFCVVFYVLGDDLIPALPMGVVKSLLMIIDADPASLKCVVKGRRVAGYTGPESEIVHRLWHAQGLNSSARATRP